MGRYYTGDIEGKFWFALQNSDDASFFGGDEREPNYICYSFGQSDLPAIKEGVKKCLAKLGDNKKKLDEFFNQHDLHNDDTLTKTGFKADEISTLLEWYARLELGE